MSSRLHVCTSTLPGFTFRDCLRLAAEAGYGGIELRVREDYHVSLPRLAEQCDRIVRRVEDRGLTLSAYNAYVGVDETDAVDALIRICRRTGVRHFRVTLPVAGGAGVRAHALEAAVVPSYEYRAAPAEVLGAVKGALRRLAERTKAAGVCALVEIHWGTVMSSFTGAHHLVGDLDPDAVAVTFDPANMVIEGREDWEYGVRLLREHVANVHVKNVSWLRDGDGWKWAWDGLRTGMVDWPHVLRLLADTGYGGAFAVEDFRVPRSFDGALDHLRAMGEDVRLLLRQSGLRRAA